MYFKVDYDRLSDIARASLNKSNELNGLYNDILKILDDVNDNWRSEDSSIYIAQMKSYLRERARENEALFKGAFKLNKIAVLYGAQDDKWEQDLKNSELVRNQLLIEEDKRA